MVKCSECGEESTEMPAGFRHEGCGEWLEVKDTPKFAHAHRTSPGAYLTEGQKATLAGQKMADDQRVEASISKHGLGANAQWQSNGQLAQAITQGQNLQAGLQWQNDRQAQWGGVTYCNKCGGTMKEDGAHNCQAAAMAQQHQMQMDAIRSNHDFARGEAFAKDELARADARATRLEARIAELEAKLSTESNPDTAHFVHGMIYRKATMRIKELEVELNTKKAQGKADWNGANQRAMRLADECGALKSQNTELLAENARLRRGGR